jgi:hypothetical protein
MLCLLVQAYCLQINTLIAYSQNRGLPVGILWMWLAASLRVIPEGYATIGRRGLHEHPLKHFRCGRYSNTP